MKEKNKNFFFGLVVGIALVALIGWVILAMGGNNRNGGKVVTSNKAKPTEKMPSESASAGFNITENDHVRGNMDASVTIVEFSDFQCPYCSRFHNTMKKVAEKYPNKVRWVYKNFPLDSIHPNARSAAEAAECAGEQGKFWEFADTMFSNQSDMGIAMYKQTAVDLGLDSKQFNNCVDTRKYKNKVNEDYQLGIKNGVRGTPGNFINGKSYPGALPFEQLQSIIDKL